MYRVFSAIISVILICIFLVSCSTEKIIINLPDTKKPDNQTELWTDITYDPDIDNSDNDTIATNDQTTQTNIPVVAPPSVPSTPSVEYRDYDFSGVSIKSPIAAVFDVYENRFIFMKSCNEDTRIYPASMTKLYMIHVAMQYLSLDEIITAGDEVTLINPYSSVARISKGDSLRVEMIIEGMLLPSGNDAAYVLATAAGRNVLGDMTASPENAIKAFIDRVNLHTKIDGLFGTHFVTPDGIHDDEHYTTVSDLIEIARIALENKIVSKYIALPKDTVTFENGKQLTWTNVNLMLDKSSSFYCPEIIGIKTGHTTPAGYCLLSAAEYKDRTIIMLVAKSDNKYYRFQDTQKLVEKFKEY